MPRFSVVIPAYGRVNELALSLQSVKDQDFIDFECIVVDDGSLDETAVADTVARVADPRFRCIRRENGGGAAARNTGILAACGDYVALLDSDDLFTSDKLSVIDRLCTLQSGHVYYSRALIDRGDAHKIARPQRAIGPGEDMGEYLFVHGMMLQTSTIVVSRDLASKVQFDAGLRKGQDLDFCLRLAATGVGFLMHERPLVVWRDLTEANRASQTGTLEHHERFLARLRPYMTARAVLGYRATVMAYDVARTDRFRAVRDVLRGWLLAGVPLRPVLFQLLNTLLPKSWFKQVLRLSAHIQGRQS